VTITTVMTADNAAPHTNVPTAIPTTAPIHTIQHASMKKTIFSPPQCHWSTAKMYPSYLPKFLIRIVNKIVDIIFEKQNVKETDQTCITT